MGQFRGVELDEVELSGTRVRLRPWRGSDADRVHAAMQDPTMPRFLPVADPYTHDDARRYVAGPDRSGGGEETSLRRAILTDVDQRVVGGCALRLGAEAEIGYWVAVDARGFGYAAEATRLLADFAYGLGLGRVSLGCSVDNPASARTALAAGFRFEGVARGRTLTAGTRALVLDDAVFARLATDDGKPIAPVYPALPPNGLSDGVLVLRGLRAGDETAMLETEDATSVRWNFDGAPPAHAEIETVVRRAPLDWLVGTTARFAMVDPVSGDFAGHIDVRRSGPPQVGGIGYGVHPAFRGRGFTSRALRLLAPWAFEKVDLALLELGAKIGNVASQRAAASAGFAPDGVRIARLRNANATFSDEVRYVLHNPAVRNSALPNEPRPVAD